ncbi:hypothetical protein [Mycolicibacterium mageritense]|jgi:hypothetical protein|nr:hypothetical protein [Mycolicibacterium mageritense]MCC9186305.1 hypothetical protein [Mycolicibacterium mageritense]
MTEENGVDTELLGQSAFHKLTHSFAIRDRLRDVRPTAGDRAAIPPEKF